MYVCIYIYVYIHTYIHIHIVGLVDDGQLHRLDADGVVDDAERARALAGRGADAAGELREVVRLPQPLEGLVPLPLAHEVVPLRNEVSEGAARPVGYTYIYIYIYIYKFAPLKQLIQITTTIKPKRS